MELLIIRVFSEPVTKGGVGEDIVDGFVVNPDRSLPEQQLFIQLQCVLGHIPHRLANL